MKSDELLYNKALNVMRNSLLFKGVSEEFLKETLGWFELIHLKKGDMISPEDTLKWMYMPIEGRVKASQINFNTGREYIVFLLSAGDIFDIIALMEDKKHEMIFEAIDDVSLLRVGSRESREWLEEHPEFNKNFLPYLGERMRYLAENASDLALYDTTTRFSKLLLRNIHIKSIKDNIYSVPLINDLSHENIAKMIGSVRAVLNRSIQKLKSDKVIEISRKEKRIKNLNELINHSQIS